MSEVDGLDDEMVETRDVFLRDIESFLRKIAPSGTAVMRVHKTPNKDDPTEKSVHFQFFDGRWIDVSASECGWSIRRSDSVHIGRPWYMGENPLLHAKMPVKGFFTVNTF